MTKVLVPTAEQIISANRYLCEQGGNTHHCYNVGKVESALHSAFYPGSHPFAAGGLVKVAAALCFYLVKSHAFMDGNKRTGALVAIAFMNENGWDLKYLQNEKKGINALATIIEACAAGNVSKEELMNWFDSHKTQV